MITNFEEITKQLSKEDYSLLHQLISGFEKRTIKNPIKSVDVVNAMNKANPHLKSKFTGVKLRKLCNFIRTNGMLGLIATSDGYYTSKSQYEIKKQILS